MRGAGTPSTREDLLLLGLALLFFLPRPGGGEFVGFDCRAALFAREMLANGPSFFPTLYGRPYPDLPVATHDADRGRLLAGCTALVFLLGGGGRWAGVAIGLAAGFAFRGPLGVVVPAGALLGRLAVARAWRALFRAAAIATVLLLLGSVVLAQAALHEGGPAFLHDVVRMQVAGRLPPDQPFHRYWVDALATYAPAFPLALVVLLVGGRRLLRRGAEDRPLSSTAFAWPCPFSAWPCWGSPAAG